MYEIPPSVPAPENLTKDVVQHLSNEIETTTNNMMTFRTRIGFSLLVGPFLLLGSLIVGAKGQLTAFKFGWPEKFALAIILACYLGIAYIASAIEAGAWDQCNKWRLLIEELRKNPSMRIADEGLWLQHRAKAGYLVGYSLLFASVLAALFIIKNAGATAEPATCPPNGSTFRVELVAPTPTPPTSEDKNKRLPKN